jgi:geranylgeranyl diphosphate synthase, type II
MDQLKLLYEEFEKHLLESSFDGFPRSSYEPVNYLMQLGGKRIRPVSLLLAHQLFFPIDRGALDAALAIEVFHNFTLAHDDIMDEAHLRRGKPTLHQYFDRNTAILSGDLMLIISYQLLIQSVPEHNLKFILDCFNEGARQICEGQQLDMDFEVREMVSLEEYETMIMNKTAVLLGVAMQIGAVIGSAGKIEARSIYHFAVNLGLAFQIQDDILDAYGDAQKVGKKVGGDILRNKKTYLWTACLDRSNEEDRKILQTARWIKSDDEKLELILTLFEKYHVRKLAEDRQAHFYTLAIQHLDELKHSVDIQPLIEFANVVIERQF